MMDMFLIQLQSNAMLQLLKPTTVLNTVIKTKTINGSVDGPLAVIESALDVSQASI